MNRYSLTLRFREDERTYLQEITDLLYSFEKLHDLSVVLTEKEYREFRFSHYFWFRKGSPVKRKHKLEAVRIVKESPLLFEVVVASVSGLGALIMAIERIRNWDLNREKLELDVRKLRREEEREKREAISLHDVTLEKLAEQRGATKIYDSLQSRLSESALVLEDLDIQRIPDVEERVEQ